MAQVRAAWGALNDHCCNLSIRFHLIIFAYQCFLSLESVAEPLRKLFRLFNLTQHMIIMENMLFVTWDRRVRLRNKLKIYKKLVF